MLARPMVVEEGSSPQCAQPRQQFFGIRASNQGRIMIFAGGVPLRRDGLAIGAIGHFWENMLISLLSTLKYRRLQRLHACAAVSAPQPGPTPKPSEGSPHVQ